MVLTSLAFRLALPSSIKIHPVFHVSLLEPHVANPFPNRIVAPPLAIQVDGVEDFEVNSILDSRMRRRKLEYYVDWVGYDVSDRSWEPPVVLTNANDAIQDFHNKFPSRPRLHAASS